MVILQGIFDENNPSWNPDNIDPYGNVEWKYLEEKTKAEATTEAEIEEKDEDALKRVAQSIFWRSRRSDITGLVYMGARYYHPLSGRFISPDPFGHSGSLDLYNYADGDPINYFDPDGRLLMKSWGKVKKFSVKHGKVGLDGVQFGLDIAGMAPVLGAIPDIANAGIHILRGQYVEAGLSATAAIPIIGDIAGAAKIAGTVYEGVNAGKKSFTKAADKELKAMGYQHHHIISDTHPKTKNHVLLEMTNFGLIRLLN